MKTGAAYTRDQIKDMAFALRADQWIVTLVLAEHEPRRGRPEVMRTSYPFRTLLRLDTIGFLRGRNAEGYHVYVRPDATEYILVDDLCAAALDQMKADGHRPAAVVMTSEENYQAWITVSKEPIPDVEATATARLLAQRYGGDPGAAKATQPGRMPGTTNRKETHRQESGAYPYTRLGACMKYVQVTDTAARVLAEAREMLSSPPSSSPSFTRRGRVPGDNLQSNLIPGEAAALYHDAVQYLFKRFSEAGFMKADGTPDRSRTDYAVACHLALCGMPENDCAIVLMAGSKKAQERDMEYVRAIINKVFNCHDVC
jgi:hypothetical protein